MMSEKTKVKIIKKNEVLSSKVKKGKVRTSRVAAREIVSTVGDWVADFHERKRDETQAALEILLCQNPQPTET